MRIALIVGLLVGIRILGSSLLMSLHFAKHPMPLDEVRSEGILSYARRAEDMVPFGFTKPSRWTSDPPRCTRCKVDALPVHTLEMLARHDWFGRRLGQSLFIDGSDDRMRRKEVYMRGLTPEALTEYRSHMRAVSPFHVASVDDALQVASDLTARIHFGRLGTDEELASIVTMCRKITDSLNGHLFVTAYRQKRTLSNACFAASDGMIGRWKRAGMNAEDCYLEMAHNIFGMTTQWAYALLHWRPPLETDQDAYEFMLDVLPATVAASRVDGALVLHDLQARCRHAPRHPVNENHENYVPFGSGDRRCPGEQLTYAFLLHCHGETTYVSSQDGFLGVNPI